VPAKANHSLRKDNERERFQRGQKLNQTRKPNRNRNILGLETKGKSREGKEIPKKKRRIDQGNQKRTRSGLEKSTGGGKRKKSTKEAKSPPLRGNVKGWGGNGHALIP